LTEKFTFTFLGNQEISEIDDDKIKSNAVKIEKILEKMPYRDNNPDNLLAVQITVILKLLAARICISFPERNHGKMADALNEALKKMVTELNDAAKEEIPGWDS